MVTDDHWTSGASCLFTRSTSNHSTLSTQMNQEQLIRCIEQQLDDLSYLNEYLFNDWCDRLYTENDEPIVERFTVKVLNQLTSLVSSCDEN